MTLSRSLRLCGLLALGCSWNAPHDNPLDPTLAGSVEGRVLNRRATGIGSATVSVPDAGRFSGTDSRGDFLLLGLPADTVTVFAACPGYAPESAQVALSRGNIDTLVFYMNGLPYFADCSLTAHVYGRSWPPGPLCFLRLSAVASDSDGTPDIDSVWVEIPSVGYARRLVFDPERNRHALTLWADSLPGRSLDTLVGQAANFRVLDRQGALGTGPCPGVSRLIYDLPSPVFPSGGLDTVRTDTTFVWHRFAAGFAVRYHGEVVRIEGGAPAGVVTSFQTPGSLDTVFRFSRALLEAGDYYWTLEAIDALGNSSRSSEELFHAR